MVPGGDCLGQRSVWTQITLKTGQFQYPAQPVAGKGQGPRSCGQPGVGPAFQGPAWHVGNVSREVPAFQKLKGKCSYMGWWVVGGGVCGNVPLVWNPEGLQLQVTLGLCQVRELTCFFDVFINRNHYSCLILLPGRPAPPGLSITTGGTFVGH